MNFLTFDQYDFITLVSCFTASTEISLHYTIVTSLTDHLLTSLCEFSKELRT